MKINEKEAGIGPSLKKDSYFSKYLIYAFLCFTFTAHIDLGRVVHRP